MNLFIAAKEKFMEDHQKQLETERNEHAEHQASGLNQVNQTEDAANRLKS
ncbi:hypothetical protein VSK91_10870 [Bacillus swezeyi]